MNTSHRFRWMLVAVFACLLPLGCGSGAKTGDHDHDGEHEHAETYKEAVAEIKEMDEHIQAALASDTPKDADHDLHEIFHFIDDLPKLAKKEEMSEEDIKAIDAAKEKLLDAYEKLDAQFHGQGEIKYEEVAEDVKSAMETLAKFSKSE